MSDKNKIRFDQYLVLKKLTTSRHQAADLIRRGLVQLNGQIIKKPALAINLRQRQRLRLLKRPHVSRAGDKLAEASQLLQLDFKDKIILDVGVHRGGFTDCSLHQGARLVVAVDVGQTALHPSLNRPEVLAFYKTDIRKFNWPKKVDYADLILVDVSFISLRLVLEGLLKFAHRQTEILVLFKPQFETKQKLRKGVLANQAQRRLVLNQWQAWLKVNRYQVLAKTDSAIWGLKGNRERFYLLKKVDFPNKNTLKR